MPIESGIVESKRKSRNITTIEGVHYNAGNK